MLNCTDHPYQKLVGRVLIFGVCEFNWPSVNACTKMYFEHSHMDLKSLKCTYKTLLTASNLLFIRFENDFRLDHKPACGGAKHIRANSRSVCLAAYIFMVDHVVVIRHIQKIIPKSTDFVIHKRLTINIFRLIYRYPWSHVTKYINKHQRSQRKHEMEIFVRFQNFVMQHIGIHHYLEKEK